MVNQLKSQLTKKDKQTIIAIRDFIIENKYPPTVRELGKILGLKSSSTVHQRIQRLVDLGIIEKGNGPRAIRFKKKG